MNTSSQPELSTDSVHTTTTTVSGPNAQTGTVSPAARASSTGGLLQIIRSIRASVGGCLNEDELTGLLRAEGLPAEEGFTFLCLSDGCVTFKVPRQDPAKWYRESGWLAVEKETIGNAIAKKLGLHVYEPPDASASFRFPMSDKLEMHHHLALGNSWETLISAHPRYLKIRLFSTAMASRHLSDTTLEVTLGTTVLRDLAALYPQEGMVRHSKPEIRPRRI